MGKYMDNQTLMFVSFFLGSITFTFHFSKAAISTCSRELDKQSQTDFNRLLNCMDLDVRQGDVDTINKYADGVFPDYADLDSCLSFSNQPLCESNLRAFISTNPDELLSRIGKTLLPTISNPSTIPNSCHCMTLHRTEVDACTSALLDDYYRYCDTFYPIPMYSSANAISDCSKAIIFSCNSSTSFDNMISCVEANAEYLPSQCSIFLGSLFNAVFDACVNDIGKFCANENENFVKDCLSAHITELSPSCSEKVETYRLRGSPCLSEAGSYCKDQHTLMGVLSCLETRIKQDTQVDSECHIMVNGLAQCNGISFAPTDPADTDYEAASPNSPNNLMGLLMPGPILPGGGIAGPLAKEGPGPRPPPPDIGSGKDKPVPGPKAFDPDGPPDPKASPSPLGPDDQDKDDYDDDTGFEPRPQSKMPPGVAGHRSNVYWDLDPDTPMRDATEGEGDEGVRQGHRLKHRPAEINPDIMRRRRRLGKRSDAQLPQAAETTAVDVEGVNSQASSKPEPTPVADSGSDKEELMMEGRRRLGKRSDAQLPQAAETTAVDVEGVNSQASSKPEPTPVADSRSDKEELRRKLGTEAVISLASRLQASVDEGLSAADASRASRRLQPIKQPPCWVVMGPIDVPEDADPSSNGAGDSDSEPSSDPLGDTDSSGDVTTMSADDADDRTDDGTVTAMGMVTKFTKSSTATVLIAVFALTGIAGMAILSVFVRRRFALLEDGDTSDGMKWGWNFGYERTPTNPNSLSSYLWSEEDATSSHALAQSEIEIGKMLDDH